MRRFLAAADAVVRSLVQGLGTALSRLGPVSPRGGRSPSPPRGDGPPPEDPRYR